MRKTSGILIKVSGKNNAIIQSQVPWSGLHNTRYYSSPLHQMLWKPWMQCKLLCFEESLCHIVSCNIFRPCHSSCHIERWFSVWGWTSVVSHWDFIGGDWLALLLRYLHAFFLLIKEIVSNHVVRTFCILHVFHLDICTIRDPNDNNRSQPADAQYDRIQ